MAEEHPSARAARMLRESGYARGGEVHPDAAEDKALIRKMVKPNALARKNGGRVHGEKSESRPDRRARGGEVKHKGAKTAVNITVGGGGQQQAAQAAQQGLAVGRQQGAQMAMQKMAAQAGPPHPPMAPPGAGAPPPGAMPPPGMRPPGAKRGGAIARAKGGGIPGDLERKPEKSEGAEPKSCDNDRDDLTCNRAKGDGIPGNLERKPKGEEFEPEKGGIKQPRAEAPNPERSRAADKRPSGMVTVPTERKRGGGIKTRRSDGRWAGGAV